MTDTPVNPTPADAPAEVAATEPAPAPFALAPANPPANQIEGNAPADAIADPAAPPAPVATAADPAAPTAPAPVPALAVADRTMVEGMDDPKPVLNVDPVSGMPRSLPVTTADAGTYVARHTILVGRGGEREEVFPGASIELDADEATRLLDSGAVVPQERANELRKRHQQRQEAGATT